MQKSILTMRLDHSSGNDDQFRTIFKTRHGRVVFLSVQLHDSLCTITSCFFPYTKQGILTLLNHEICCDFTHILVTDGIDLDSNHTPLCGAV